MNTLSWIVDNSFSTRLTLALLHFVWQGCAGGFVVIVGGWLLRRATARSRYVLNVTMMLLMAACLPITFLRLDTPGTGADRLAPVPAGEFPAFSVSNGPPAVATGEHNLSVSADVVPSHESSRKPDAATVARPKAVNAAANGVPQPTQFTSRSTVFSTNDFAMLARWVVVWYLTGVTLILGRLLRGVWGGNRLRKVANAVKDPTLLETVRQQAARLGLKVVPTIAWCEQISVPVVVGIITPMILLPMAVASGLTPSQLQALLLHELSHIRRFDPIVNLLQRIVEAALFFHPVVWFVSRRISIERELAADDMVLAAGWDRPLYADALVRVAELAANISDSDVARGATVLGASGSNPSEFKTRVLRLLNEAPPPKLDLTRVGIASTLLLLVVGGTIAWSQSNRTEPAAAPSKPVEADVETAKPNEDDEDDIVITGRVIDARGEPVEKAIVACSLGYDRESWKRLSLTGETDRAGIFRLSIKQSEIPPGMKLAGSLKNIWAWASGYAIGVAEFDGSLDVETGKPSPPGKPVDIKLPNRSQSVFIAKTETGEPLKGATVVPRFVRVPNGSDPLDGYFGLYDQLPDALLEVAKRVTDVGGRVVIDSVSRAQLDELEVISQSHGAQSMKLTAPADQEVLTMSAVGSLRGKLIGRRPELTGSVRLRASTRKHVTEGYADVVINEDGSFHIPAIAIGRLRFQDNLDPDLPWRLVYVNPIDRIEAGIENEVSLGVVPGIPVTGRLVRRGDNELVKQARVSVHTGPTAYHNSHTTNDRGEFQTFVVPGLQASFQVVGLSGNPDLTYPATTQAQVAIPENVDSFRIPDIEIPKARTWTGRLVDQSDQPIVGKYVQAFGQLTPLDHPARTGADGTFKLKLRDDQIPNRWSALFKWDKRPSDVKDSLPAEIVSTEPFVLRVKLPGDVTTFRKPPLLLPDHWIVTAVGFDNNGKELVTASIQGGTTIRRWDVVNKKLISEIKLEGDIHGRALREETLTLSADCRKVIAATSGYVGIWDTATGKLLNKLPIPKIGDSDTIGMLACTPDLSVIAGNLTTGFSRLTLRYDAHTVVWNAVSDKAFRILKHKGQNELIAMSLSSDGTRLATANGSGAFIWDTTTGEQRLEVTNDNTGRQHADPEASNQFNNNVWSIQFSPDDKLLAMGDTFGVKLLDSTSGKLVQQIEGPYRYSSGRSPGLVFSKDGQMVARLGTGHKPEQDSPLDSRLPTPLTPLITTVGTAGSTQYVIPIWSIPAGQKLFELHTNSNDAAFSNDGQQLAVAFSDLQQAVSVWQLNCGGSDPDQTEGPGPEPRQDKVEQNGHYRGKTAAEFIDKFSPTWSAPKLGIQYGIALTKPQRQYHSGEQVPLVAFFRNASDKPLQINMQPDYLGNASKVTDAKGAAVILENIPLVGQIPLYGATLQPGEAVGPFYFNVALGENPRPGKQHWYPLFKTPTPGTYTLKHSVSFNVGETHRNALMTPGEITSGQISFEIVEGQ